MRFYTGQHEYYCGSDLHARTLYLCVLDSTGTVRLHRGGEFPMAFDDPGVQATIAADLALADRYDIVSKTPRRSIWIASSPDGGRSDGEPEPSNSSGSACPSSQSALVACTSCPESVGTRVQMIFQDAAAGPPHRRPLLRDSRRPSLDKCLVQSPPLHPTSKSSQSQGDDDLCGLIRHALLRSAQGNCALLIPGT